MDDASILARAMMKLKLISLLAPLAIWIEYTTGFEYRQFLSLTLDRPCDLTSDY